VLAVFALFGVIGAFSFFIYSMVTGDIFATDSVFGIMLNIFLFLGIMLLSLIVMAFCLIRYVGRKGSVNTILTKRCPSCGTEMGVTEMSYPRCFTLQPADEKHWRR
jgi:hypothetical protein